MRMKGEGDRPLPKKTYLEHGVVQKVKELTGIIPKRAHHVNVFDTIIKFTGEASVFIVAKALHGVAIWEGLPVRICCLMGG